MRLITDSPQYPPYDFEGECAKIAQWITTPPDSLIKASARWMEKRELNANKTRNINLNSVEKHNMTLPKLNNTSCNHLAELTPQISNSSFQSRRLHFRVRRSVDRSANSSDNFPLKRTIRQRNIDRTAPGHTKRCVKDGNCGENATKTEKIEESATKNEEFASKNEKIGDENAEFVSLFNWNVIVNLGKVFLEGFKMGDCEPKLWRTSQIEKRVKRNVVRSVSGTAYCLVGRLVDAGSCGGIPKEVATKFSRGFPVNWRKLLLERNTKLGEKRGKRIKLDAESSNMQKPVDQTDINSLPRTRSGRVITSRLTHWEQLSINSRLDNAIDKQAKTPARPRRLKNRKKTPEKVNFQLPHVREEPNTLRPTPKPVPQRRRSVSKAPPKKNIFHQPAISKFRTYVADLGGPASRTRSRTNPGDGKMQKSPVKTLKTLQNNANGDKDVNYFPRVVLTRRDLVEIPARDAKSRRDRSETPETRSNSLPVTTKTAQTQTRIANVGLTVRKSWRNRSKTPQKSPKSSKKGSKVAGKRTATPQRAPKTPTKPTTTQKRTATSQNRSRSPQRRPKKLQAAKPVEKRTKSAPKSRKAPEKRSKTPEKRVKTPEKRTRTPLKLAKTHLNVAVPSQNSKNDAKQAEVGLEKLAPVVSARPGTLTYHRQVLDVIRHQNANFEADFFSASNFDVGKIVKLPTRGSVTDLDCLSDTSSAVTPNARIPMPEPVSRHRTPEREELFGQPLPDELFRRKEVDSYIHNRRKKGQGPHVHERFRQKPTGTAKKSRKTFELAKSILNFDSSVDGDDFRDEGDDSDFYFED